MDNASRTTSPDPDAAKPPITKPESTSTPLDLSGTTLGDFRLLRRLGQGGMGQVYLAEQLSLKRKVALKIMRPERAVDAVSLQRFKAEAEAVARVTHANIVQVYAIGEVSGVHFIALEYVEGRNLRDFVARKGPPEALHALSIIRQVAAALQRASEMGIIHRDVKPENILLTRKGEVKVADFGLSRCFAGEQQPLNLTQTGVTMGTPLYMSPEQVEGKPLDPRTDIYSLGVTCYHMLTGQPPFRGETPFQVALQHVQSEPTPLWEIRPDLPAELSAIVHKMMAKDPAQRYQTCRDLMKDLGRVREALGSQRTQGLEAASSPSVPSLVTEAIATPALSRHAGLVGLAAASLVLALAVGALLGWARSRPVATAPTQPRPGPASTEDSIGGLFSAAEREQFLKTKVQELANPRDPARRQQGVEFALELGTIYVNQWRLDEAERFFSELINNPHKVKEYGTLGKVGRASVLAFRNNPSDSNRLFRELASDKKLAVMRFDQTPRFLDLPQLRYLIARALEYNAANATKEEPFPPELEYLRRPPNPQGGGGPRRGDKPANKN